MDVTYAELLHGVSLSSKKRANQVAVDAPTSHLAILEWSRDAAQHHALIRADLKKIRSMVGANDLMIAAQRAHAWARSS